MFTVYQNHSLPCGIVTREHITSWQKGRYEIMAVVNANNLEEVFQACNAEEDDCRIIWESEYFRSLSVGDVVITPNGAAFMCESQDWRCMEKVVECPVSFVSR